MIRDKKHERNSNIVDPMQNFAREHNDLYRASRKKSSLLSTSTRTRNSGPKVENIHITNTENSYSGNDESNTAICWNMRLKEC